MSQSARLDGSKLFSMGTVIVAMCSVSLFFLLASWLLGGTDYKDSLLGNELIPLLSLGIAIGIGLRLLYRSTRRRTVLE